MLNYFEGLKGSIFSLSSAVWHNTRQIQATRLALAEEVRRPFGIVSRSFQYNPSPYLTGNESAFRPNSSIDSTAMQAKDRVRCRLNRTYEAAFVRPLMQYFAWPSQWLESETKLSFADVLLCSPHAIPFSAIATISHTFSIQCIVHPANARRRTFSATLPSSTSCLADQKNPTRLHRPVRMQTRPSIIHDDFSEKAGIPPAGQYNSYLYEEL